LSPAIEFKSIAVPNVERDADEAQAAR